MCVLAHPINWEFSLDNNSCLQFSSEFIFGYYSLHAFLHILIFVVEHDHDHVVILHLHTLGYLVLLEWEMKLATVLCCIETVMIPY